MDKSVDIIFGHCLGYSSGTVDMDVLKIKVSETAISIDIGRKTNKATDLVG